MSDSNNRLASLLLAGGALLGAILATSGLLESAPDMSAAEALAQVNEERINKTEYLAYLDLLARDKRNPMTAADRRHVLDRLIEEKLLLQRALAIDLPFSDPKVRKTIINAMIETVSSDSASAAVSDTELADFYDDNQAYFAAPARALVRRMSFRGDNAPQRATQAAQSLTAGEPWEAVSSDLADPDILALPTSALPVTKLRGYLGPTLTDTALALSPGEHSEPVAGQSGFTIVQLQALVPSVPPPLEQIRDQVVREYQRRAADRALREYLDDLRRVADVEIDEAFLRELDQLEAAATSGD